MINNFIPKLIHIAIIHVQNRGFFFLLLRQIEPFRYIWFQEDRPNSETETTIWGGTAEEALLSAYKFWKLDNIRTLNCGFKYTLPERDEVGTNALFHQMASSYSSTNGIYFDEELCCNCFVQNASLEARDLLSRFH